MAKEQTLDERAARRAKEDKILAAQQKVTGSMSTALLAIPAPWGELAALSAALTSVAFGIAIKLRKHASLVLAGDEKAIAGFMRRAARWNAKKRERVAVRLGKELTREKHRIAKKAGHNHRASDTLLVHMKTHQMKLAALVALHVASLQKPREALIAGDASTTPVNVEADPTSGLPDASEASFSATMIAGIPVPWLIAGAVAAVAAVYVARHRPAAQP